MKIYIDEKDVSVEDWNRAMDKLAWQGFLLFVSGLLSFGLIPLIYCYFRDRKL